MAMMAVILKIVKCDILATIWPILVKFGKAMHIRPPNLTVDQKFQNPRWRTVAILKVKKFWYLQNVWPFLENFVTSHISVHKSLTAARKVKFLKIQDGGGAPFNNC